MCFLCAAMNPRQADAEWQSHSAATAPLAADPTKSDTQEIADYLVRGFWEEAYPSFSEDHDPRKFAVQAGDTLTYSFKGMSDGEKAIARAALDAWTEVSGLQFRQVNNGADIRFVTDDPLDVGGAYSYSIFDGWTGDSRKIDYSVVSIDSNWDSRPISLNSYWFQTYMHEIGHALGLGHAGQYNGEGTVDREFKYDSWQLSIMSYVSQDENRNVSGEYAFLGTLMAADILAIQDIYGDNVRANHGDSVYGYKSNIGGPLGQMMQAWLDDKPLGRDVWRGNPLAFTVYDTGGRDVINLSGARGGQRINLGEGAVSDFMGVDGGMVIAYGSIIENAVGGRGSDRFMGNAAGNRLDGRAGDDRLSGLEGADRLLGGAGHDVLNGGAGLDTAIFTAKTAIRVALGKSGAQQTGEGRDSFVGIENVQTGRGNDRLTGSTGDNVLTSGRGDDRLFGCAGDDRLSGAKGQDTLSGGLGDDTLLGGKGHAVLQGDAGNDLILGGAAGDLLNGGEGNDTLTGGGGADVFRFAQGQDHITDFQDNLDTLEISATLWGGGARTVGQVLAFASVQAEGVVFDFGNGHVLTLAGLTDTAQLQNDLRIL